MKNYINKIICGDSQKILKQIPDNSIDLIVTDPPYGISFMGKDWDKALSSIEIWRECLRVLKPGAFALVMCIPRSDCQARQIIALEETGFNVSFPPIYHTFASGFPKAQNISKVVDKKECKKKLTEKLGRKPSKDEFEKEWEKFRKIVGQRKMFGTARKIKGGQRIGASKTSAGTNIEFEESTIINETIPTTSQAKALDGAYAGFQPKPSLEVILVCMKSLSKKTFVGQALKNQKGITWLDDCRIPYKSDYDKKHQSDIQKGQINADRGKFFGGEGQSLSSGNLQGRFPANLLCSDDVLNDGKEYGLHYNDSGSFSRYFSLDKWWEEKVKQLPERVRRTFPFLIVPKANKAEKNKGLEEFENKDIEIQKEILKKSSKFSRIRNLKIEVKKNIHPTVKPIKLMCYLIILGSREGDIILDPFVGSGTTCISAKMFNRNFIGIEKSKEYCKIAEARIKAIEPRLF